MLGIKMMNATEKKLKQLERMVECAYFSGFDFDEERHHTPKFAAQVLVNELRDLIIQEMILARGRGVVHTALITD
jgi:hypothetical protein